MTQDVSIDVQRKVGTLPPRPPPANALNEASSLPPRRFSILMLALRRAEQLFPGVIEAALAQASQGGAAARIFLTTQLQQLPVEQQPLLRTIWHLLTDPGMTESLPAALDTARTLPPLTEPDYRVAMADATWPAVGRRMSQEEFACLVPDEQGVLARSLAALPLEERIGALLAQPLLDSSGDGGGPAQTLAYTVCGGDLTAPTARDSAPIVADVVLERAPEGTFLKILFDHGTVTDTIACSYVEVDTGPSFASPNLVLWPPLCFELSGAAAVNNRNRYIMRLTALREQVVPPPKQDIVLPIPIELMTLPTSRRRIKWRHIGALALRLKALGGNDERLARLAFEYAKCMIWFGMPLDPNPRTVLDTLRSGVGGCGDLSNVGALLLELCGVRTRGVSGFTPSLRAKYPGGSHSAYEFFDRDRGRWRYFDPFFDLFLPVSAAELADSPHGQIVVNRFPGSVPAERTLAELFTYRRYFDRIGRLRVMSFLDLDDEAAYGLDWELATPGHFIGRRHATGLAPLPRTLHVRCRYLAGQGMVVGHYMNEEVVRQYCAPMAHQAPTAVLSPWEYRRLDIASR